MIGETRVLANCGYGTPICQTFEPGRIFQAILHAVGFEANLKRESYCVF
jgi:hypothetical protein